MTRAGSHNLQVVSRELTPGACETSKLSATASNTSALHSLSWGGVWAVRRGEESLVGSEKAGINSLGSFLLRKHPAQARLLPRAAALPPEGEACIFVV